MTDVFIRHAPSEGLREMLFLATMARFHLALTSEDRITVLDTRQGSLREIREMADMAAQSDPYIFCDDDILLLGKDWVPRACAIMLRNPDYLMASTLSVIEGENMAKPPSDDVEIYPMHAVGQPMLVRKGACAKLPEITMNNECGEMHAMVLAMGKKQGLLWGNPPLRHMHMGHGFSSNPNLHWGY